MITQKFHVLFVTSVSACFELENNSVYQSDGTFDVFLNGERVLTDVQTNVFSLFDLQPNTEYGVSIGEEVVHFMTEKESACLLATAFGVAADGVTDDTVAIQNAIDCCPKYGRVRFPAGKYCFTSLTLKSFITLELCQGAYLLADPVEAHYPILPGEITDPTTGEMVQVSSWEGNPFPCRKSILTAFGAEGIRIVGKGVIDGNAQNSTWWENVKSREIGRPKLCFFNKCEDIAIHGITGKNSPCWHFHPFFSENIRFLDMQVEAPRISPNTDGINPESCNNVQIVGVRFSVGDDAIAIKSGKIYMGMKYKTPARNHVIRNCYIEHAHGAVVLGSEMAGGIKELSVSQCLFVHTDRGLRIKTRRKRGKYAVVDGVVFSNIQMRNVKAPLVMNMYYNCDPDGNDKIVWSKEPHPVDDTTPYLGRFVFRDMECTDCEWAAGFFYGLPEQPIESVLIDNVSFTFKEDATSGYPALMSYTEKECRLGLYFRFTNQVRLQNVTMEGQVGPMLIAQDVKEKCIM